MSGAREMLEGYLHFIGMAQPADAAQQFQVTLLRQWISHLDEVLRAEKLSPDCVHRIIRGMIYGGVPVLAEAGVRDELAAQQAKLLGGLPASAVREMMTPDPEPGEGSRTR